MERRGEEMRGEGRERGKGREERGMATRVGEESRVKRRREKRSR